MAALFATITAHKSKNFKEGMTVWLKLRPVRKCTCICMDVTRCVHSLHRQTQLYEWGCPVSWHAACVHLYGRSGRKQWHACLSTASWWLGWTAVICWMLDVRMPSLQYQWFQFLWFLILSSKYTMFYLAQLYNWNHLTFMWPCIMIYILIIKPTRCTNFSNLFLE